MDNIKTGVFYLCILSFMLFTDCSMRNRIKRKEAHIGKVPDEKTAIKIAEAIWLPIFGEGIYNERPFTATLTKGVWYVYGYKPDTVLGGVAEIKIRQSDCKILFIQHLK